MTTGPIADLTYRNYDGPLEPPSHRWFAIAKLCVKLAIQKKGFWIAACLSGYWYLILCAVFYFIDMTTQGTNVANPIFKQIVWKDQFLNAFSISQMLLLIIALMLGSGSIANDNRAKALLVYLSKPCTKMDYIVGKWFGIFAPITLVVAAPTLFFYFYCLMSYRSYGFFSSDPWLIAKLLGMILVPGVFHASVSLGISSMFDQGRNAGATYAGIYFLALFFTKAMQIVHAIRANGDGQGAPIADTLYYFGIDGIQIGLAKILLGTPGSPLLPNQLGNRRNVPIDIPNPVLMWGLFFGLCALGLLIAWRRVRAVEVVG